MGSKGKGREVHEVPRILFVSDAVASTGFARVCHSLCDRLYKKYDLHVLGVNYFGDPHKYPYKIYPAAIGGDVFGIGRLESMVKAIKPHLVFMINDPWLIKDYLNVLTRAPVGKMEDGRYAFPNLMAYMPVDGLNLSPEFVEPLNVLNLAVGYTQFGIDELQKAHLTTHTAIIPHGADNSVFKPVQRSVARKALNLSDDWYIVGCCQRNQPRKRIDLTMQYFAEWAKDKPDTVKLYFHGATKDVGWNIEQMADYFGIQDRLILTARDLSAGNGVPIETMRNIYSSFDIHMSTALGEGWSLTVHESMACGIANIVPEWSALAEWPRGGVSYIPCTSIQMNPGGINTVGGIADKQAYIQELEHMYQDAAYRQSIAKAGFDLVSQPKFSWDTIANQFDQLFMKVLQGKYVNHDRNTQ